MYTMQRAVVLSLFVSTAFAQLDERWFADVASGPAGSQQAGQPAVDPTTGNLVLIRSDMTAWSWDGATLTQVAAGVPPARRGAMIAPIDDGGVRGIACFGGHDGTSARADTWLLSGGQWTPVTTPVSPPARAYGAAAARNGRMLISTGTLANDGGGGDTGVWILPCMSDTWQLSSAGGGQLQWQQIALNDTTPPARAGGTMCSDAAGNLVLCGGGNPTQTMHDSWMYSAAADAWVEVAIGSSPTPVNGQMAYDSLRGIGVLTAFRFSGLQTWHFDFASATWTLATPAVELVPSQFTNFGYVAYQPAHAETIYVDRAYGISVLSIADAVNAGTQPASCARVLGLGLVAQSGGPRLSGGGYALTVTGATPGMPVVLAGGDQPLATPLPIGPGCLAFFGNIWETRVQIAGATTTFAVPLANAPWLIGIRIDHQVVEIDPSNGWFTAVSGDLHVILGR